MKKLTKERLIAGVSVAVAIAGVILATRYRRERDEAREELMWDEAEHDPTHEWFSFPISMMDEVRNGAVLKLRIKPGGPMHQFFQTTTRDDFSEEQNKRFEDYPGE